MRYIPITSYTTDIEIGKKGEHETSTVVFVIPPDWPEGVANYQVRVLRPTETDAYVSLSASKVDNVIYWLITDTDTAIEGYGKVQIVCMVDGKVAKTRTVATYVADSIGDTVVPEPQATLLDTAVAAAQAAAVDADEAKTAAEAAVAQIDSLVVEAIEDYIEQHPEIDVTYTISISGRTITLSGSDGSSVDITVPDTDLSNYLTVSEITRLVGAALNGYATESWVESKGYLTQHQSLDGYATSADLEAVEAEIPSVPSNVSAFTNDAGYLTQHQDISGKQDAPSSSGTAGQVLGLDSNLDPVWLNQGGGGGGVSPTVTVVDITGGHRVTITDADHPTGQSFDVMDGQDASDTEVTQTSTTTSGYTYWRPLLIGQNSSSTESGGFSTVTDSVRAFNNLRVQPSTGTIKATTFKGDLDGTASGNYSATNPPPGVIPTGGSTAQVLAKKTDTDYDVEWVNQSGGGGAVNSVDGKTGDVVVLPAGGAVNYVLKKNSASDYDVKWASDNNTYTSCYCSTSASTAAKVGTCSNYALSANSYLHVTMANSNTKAAALTLNVNSKGAKPIYINGAASSSSNYTLPAGTYIVFYDGTNYYFRTDGKLTASITGSAAETDPVFSASPAAGITSSDISTWNGKSDFSGSYNDLTDKPSIPAKTSDLQNDSGFITTETDPVFSASPAAGITSSDITAWNGKSNFSGSYNDLTDKPTIPEDVSDLNNDVPYMSMGLGTNIPANSNLNNYTTPGVYYVAASSVAATITNGPRTDVAYRLEVTYLNGTKRIRQTVYTLGSASLSYTRCRSGNDDIDWQPWVVLTLQKAEVLTLGAADSGINRWARVIYDPNSSTVRVHLTARNTSANISNTANLGTVPEGYRPSADTTMQVFLVLADGSAHAYYGVVKADGTIHQSFGTTIREVLLVGEYTI